MVLTVSLSQIFNTCLLHMYKHILQSIPRAINIGTSKSILFSQEKMYCNFYACTTDANFGKMVCGLGATNEA